MPQTTTAPRKKTRLMTEGGIFKNLLLFAVPLILGNLLQQLYNTADSIIVGNFLGSNALAAVGSSGSPIFLLIGFSQGVAVGAGVVVAQYLGAKDREDAQIAVHTSLAIAAILGVVLTVGGIELDDRTKEVTLDGDKVSLTRTEYDILKMLMENPGKVFSPTQIYTQVWKDNPYGAENTVAVHIRHLREKIEYNPAEPRYLKAVWGRGYKMGD